MAKPATTKKTKPLSKSQVLNAIADAVGEEVSRKHVKAVVELAPGVKSAPELADELLAFCHERLARFKCPRSIDFVDSLPRDPNGKLYKRQLRDPYWVGRERAI